MSVAGGSALTLCESGPTRGIDWSTDGWIVFASPEHRGLSRVSAAGGTPEPLTSLAEAENTQRWPQVLPGGGAVLYSAVTRGLEADGSSIMVQKLPTGKPERLRQGGFHARYLPSGHLVYLQGGTLFAAAFDLDALAIQGQPAPVLEEVVANNIGAALFDVSSEGTLVYVQGSISERLYEFEWVDREGNRQTLSLPKGDYEGFALSPRGEKLAYVLDDGPQTDIWIYDTTRNVSTRLTFDLADDYRPIWSPSGETIVFASNRSGVMNLFCKRVDGSDTARRLHDSPNVQLPWSWHPAGRRLAILNNTHEGGWDLGVLTLEGNDRSGWTAGETTDYLREQVPTGIRQ